jgi:hypothetical protein
MVEPGLDLHEWQTRWEELQELAADEPDRALPEIVRLVRQMLTERGFDLDNPVAEEGEDPDLVGDYFAAADIAERIEAGAEVERVDVAQALENLREVYEYLVADRAAP